MPKGKPTKKEQQKAIQENQEVLSAELAYIGNTAFQTNEDRQRVAQFFFISFGSFIAAIFSLQIGTIPQQDIFFILGFVFLFVTFFGVSTLRQLTRLRQAWLESVQAMNRLKTHIQQSYTPALDDVFEWLEAPPAYKKDSVGYHQAIQVSVGTGTSLGSSIAFFLLASNLLDLWSVTLIGTILALGAAYFLFNRSYKRVLQDG